jgi:hypothetical protein
MSLVMDVLSVGLGLVVVAYIYIMFFQQTSRADGFSDFYPVKNELCNMPATSSDTVKCQSQDHSYGGVRIASSHIDGTPSGTKSQIQGIFDLAPCGSQRSGPGPATLDSPRVAYNLLGDYLEPAVGPGEAPRTANLTSECAYIADGERLIEKTGSYGQITNNYKRAKPDNGSTWLHELSVSFYAT